MSLNPAHSVLLWPFEQGLLEAPHQSARIVFQNAAIVPGLQQLASEQLLLIQAGADQIDPLTKHYRHAPVLLEKADEFDLAFFLPERQRAQTRAHLVRLLRALKAGGLLLVALANDWGARSIESDLAELAGGVESVSKNKCRIFWVKKNAINADIASRWLADEQARQVDFLGVMLLSKPGVFSWAGLDRGSHVLIKHFPGDLSGRCAELGAGIGPVGIAALEKNSRLNALDSYEASHDALMLCQQNLQAWQEKNRRSVELGFYWHDVRQALPRSYDVIISNPPFHQGRADAPELGQQFIQTAANALVEGGRFILVANRHLPYEKLLKESFKTGFHLADEDGFKVIEAIK
jgi:16S rRNA (guanine1207-N2)-methyltransferase